MFVLSTIKHTIEILPNALGRDFIETLIEQINKQFANYVNFSLNIKNVIQ